MYYVFTSIIHTAKGNFCAREEFPLFDAQKVYDSILDDYQDHVSTKHCDTNVVRNIP
jgi:hypothetical protein